MGYWLRGQIVITGRAKDLIIINGRNIWPQDIEWAVEKVDGVREGGVAAFSVDDGSGERIVVVAERRGLSAEALGELRRELGRVVQSAAGAPAEIVLARPHSMVMTSSGKLSRAKVKAKYLDGAFDEPSAEAEPRALAEARV
jgi:fatty-acyl-CoA synthase